MPGHMIWTAKFLEARQSRFIENFEADDFCLDEVRVEVFCHFVFVNLDPSAAGRAESGAG